MRRSLLFAGAAAAALGWSWSASAQRAGENAVNSADDAFGTSIGDQTVGLYSSNSARGFSPQQAGNIRLDGLYFDQGMEMSDALTSRTAMRVGLSAQSYPFPAPTGIADVEMRRPGDETEGSVTIAYGPLVSGRAEVIAETPLVKDRLRVLGSLAFLHNQYNWRGTFRRYTAASALNWTPNDNLDVLFFGDLQHYTDGEAQPFIFTGGLYEPPKYDRSVYFGEPWAERYREVRTAGIITRANLGEWRLRVGAFRATNELVTEYNLFFRNVQPDGSAFIDAAKGPSQWFGSNSGEARLSRTYAEALRQHTVHFAVKARDVLRLFGGSHTLPVGPGRIGVPNNHPEPDFMVGPHSRDDVLQLTPGAAYVMRWAGVGEFSAGVQKSFYERTIDQPALPLARTESSPWLYNATLAGYLSPDAALYAGYTRGLEESGIAPETANNRGEALPASITAQVDAGLRYRLTPQVTLIAGVFEVKKPFFERDGANIFRNVGDVSHKGVELSVSGQIAPGLTVVAGAMLLKARVAGGPAATGVIGPVPAARPNRIIRLTAQYGPPEWRGFSVNAGINHDGRMYANRANTLRLAPLTTFDAGVRYNFRLYGHGASFRAQVQNVTNVWQWSVSSNGSFQPVVPRRFSATLVTDF
ncbi:MAG: TonB-dependent siderophore receptor [Rhodospirillaceae bacterium]